MHCLRIQPAGLSLRHRSETSNDSAATGLHVFRFLHQVRSPDTGTPGDYGDEVILLRAPRHWANGDVEGVCVKGSTAKVVARFPLRAFLARTAALDGDLDADDLVPLLTRRRARVRGVLAGRDS